MNILKPKLYKTTSTMVTEEIFLVNKHFNCMLGNRTWDHVIISQELRLPHLEGDISLKFISLNKMFRSEVSIKDLVVCCLTYLTE